MFPSTVFEPASVRDKLLVMLVAFTPSIYTFMLFSLNLVEVFKYLSEIDINQNSWKVMGSSRYITDTGYFQYKAKQAYNTSLDAIKYESENKECSANIKWRDIYGTKF